VKKQNQSQQLWSGSWYKIDDSYWHECCYCSTIHAVDFKLEQGRILMRWTVNEKQTELAREARKLQDAAKKKKTKKKRSRA